MLVLKWLVAAALATVAVTSGIYTFRASWPCKHRERWIWKFWTIGGSRSETVKSGVLQTAAWWFQKVHHLWLSVSHGFLALILRHWWLKEVQDMLYDPWPGELDGDMAPTPGSSHQGLPTFWTRDLYSAFVARRGKIPSFSFEYTARKTWPIADWQWSWRGIPWWEFHGAFNGIDPPNRYYWHNNQRKLRWRLE